MTPSKPRTGKKPAKANLAALKGVCVGGKAGKDVAGQGELVACWNCGTPNDVPVGTNIFVCFNCATINWLPESRWPSRPHRF